MMLLISVSNEKKIQCIPKVQENSPNNYKKVTFLMMVFKSFLQ